MTELGTLEGHNLRFRLVQPEDAAYTQNLRASPDHGHHLSAVAPSADAQRAWTEGYKAREAAGREFYFVIERRDDDARCGVVRLYDVTQSSLTWGSWILDINKPAKAALDSALLIYRIAFGALKCGRAVFDVRADNAHTLAFHRRFGAIETGSDQLNVYFKPESEVFSKLAPALDAVFLSSEQA